MVVLGCFFQAVACLPSSNIFSSFMYVVPTGTMALLNQNLITYISTQPQRKFYALNLVLLRLIEMICKPIFFLLRCILCVSRGRRVWKSWIHSHLSLLWVASSYGLLFLLLSSFIRPSISNLLPPSLCKSAELKRLSADNSPLALWFLFTFTIFLICSTFTSSTNILESHLDLACLHV